MERTMSRAQPLARSALPIALACAGCTAPAWKNFTSYDPPADESSSSAPATTDINPTTGSVLTSTSSTSSTGPADTTGAASTTLAPVEPPSILDVEFVPDPLLASGQIHVTVTTDDADEVTMQVDGGNIEPLDAGGPGKFTGTITYYSAAANGQHTALFVPRREDLPGPEVSRDFLVDLPPAGSEIFWEAIDLLGKGYVAAVALLPGGDVVEFGTLTDAPSRCYLRRRTPQGAWDDDDVLILSETPCVAIDLGVAADGALYLLADRTGVGDLSWWLARAPSFGAPPDNLRFGSPGEKANALAMHPQRLAVCGTQPTPATDLDAMLRIVNFDESGLTKGFDYEHPIAVPHLFTETPHDCAFSADDIILVGTMYGKVDPNNPNSPKLDRRFILEYDTSTDDKIWVVDLSPDETLQTGIESVAADDIGNYVTGGYTCSNPCASPKAELRAYSSGGLLTWQMDLLPTLSIPSDVAWSPAGYLIFTSAMELDQSSSAFFVQAWKPGIYPALWSYDQNVAPTIHMANTIAIGTFGQIYTGGVGASGYPAVAFING